MALLILIFIALCFISWQAVLLYMALLAVAFIAGGLYGYLSLKLERLHLW